jgi:predicted alpha-1,2-mannosidase
MSLRFPFAPGRRALFAGLWLAIAGTTAFVPRTVCAEKSPADYVNPLIDTHKSRWFYFSSACRPFGMVNLSPDTSVGDDWLHGYLYGDTNIQCFSHIHGWQIYGVPVMPITGEFDAQNGLAAAASPFSHDDEIVRAGYHKVFLQRYGVTVELTSTTRVGFHRYTFPAGEKSYIAFDTGATLMAPMDSSAIRQVSPTEIAGQSVMSATTRRPKPFTVYFVAQFSRPVKFGAWRDKKLLPDSVQGIAGTNVGGYVWFPTKAGEQILMKVAISYTSEENARKNLAAELPGWNFDAVVRASRADWNDWLGRIAVTGGTEAQRIKFYTDLWHALLGRRIVSDVDGSYCDNTGSSTVIRRARRDTHGQPLFPHYNFDALWGSHWSLNILWAFAYPDVMDGFCHTMADMYRDGGLIPRGPAGGNYTYVMIGDPAAPFFAAAYNQGIRGYDAEAAYEGLRKNALPGGIRDHAGYEATTNASGGGMKYYIERGYVPEQAGGTGMHQDSASMTLEYAYEDWCLAQLAKSLGKDQDYEWLMRRSYNYTNLWDPSVKFMRPRNRDGSRLADFSPVGAWGAFHTEGFTEANSAIYTHFVPQDLPGLIRLFGGEPTYVRALNRQFERAAPFRFVVPHDEHGGGWVDYDNEPSMALAHLFNLAGAPWLSQKWVRTVQREAYGDITPMGGYNGDEDQGQLGALGVLMAIGLFDVEGGAATEPTYQITTPLFDRITIRLNQNYFPGRQFVITTHNNSPTNTYIQSATLDGQPLNRFWFEHRRLINGGTLDLQLGPKPSQWGANRLRE